MQTFATRATTPELMDTEACSFEDFRACLEQLAQVNRLSLAYRPTLAFLDELHRTGRLSGPRPIRIADIGCGYGDMLRRIDRWAERRGIAVDLEGVDFNPWSARAAREVTPPGRPIRWVTENLFDYRPDTGIDIVVSSLFTHHLHDDMLIRFVRWMEERSRIAWLVNDLQRHPLPYYAVKLAFFATRRHRFMQHDGPVSIASAFRRSDWLRYGQAAGIPPGAVSIEHWMPFRLRVSRIKAATHEL